MIQYFRVNVERSISLSSTFNLRIYRLMKDKEARENGFAFGDSWTYVGEMKGVDERNAMCITAMLESPRDPLQNKEEEAAWQERLQKLLKPSINLTSTSQVPA